MIWADVTLVHRSLLDPPMANETLTATVQVVSLQGNSVDARPFVELRDTVAHYTLADYGTQFVTHINITGARI